MKAILGSFLEEEKMAEEETDEIHRIEEDMKLVGFPFEIEVTSVLKKSGWNVQNQVYYLDKNEGKPRSVDIIASKAWFEDFGAYDRLNINLVIECKKSVKPWVFFMTPKDGRLFDFSFFYVKNFSEPQLERSIGFIEWAKKHIHYVSLAEECAVISYEPFKKGEGREILEATHQVTNALTDRLEFFAKARKLTPMQPAFLLYPVIVFDGHIFEYGSQGEGLRLSKSRYLQYLMMQEFLVDIMEKNFLSDYLKIVDEEITTLKTELKRAR
jgi:hypothetical protein